MSEPRIDREAFVAPGVIVRGSVTIGPRAVLMFGVVMRAEMDEIVVGEETNLQDNVVVHCDAGFPARIGSRTTIGHAAVVHGSTIGDNCLVGIGALTLNGSTMGEGAWLAAGSVLPEGKSVPPWTLAVGTPAKPLRELTGDEIERQRKGVASYLALGEMYRSRSWS